MNSHRPTLLISNVLPTHPGDEAYNNICVRLQDRFLEAALPNWSVIRECAQEDGAEGAALRAQHVDTIITIGGKGVHPGLYSVIRGYEVERCHWYHADHGRIALADYAAHMGAPLLGIYRNIQIINRRKPVLRATETHDRAYREHDQHLQWRQAVLGFNRYGSATKNDGEGEYERVHMDNDSPYRGYARSTGAHVGRTSGQTYKTPGTKPSEHIHRPGIDSGELFAVQKDRERSLPFDQEKSSLRATLEATSAPPSPSPVIGSSVSPPSPPPVSSAPPVLPPSAQQPATQEREGETTRPPPTGKAGTHNKSPADTPN